MMKKILLSLLVLIILVLFVGTGWFLYDKSNEKPVTYDTDSLYVTDIVKKTVATGSIKPRKEIEIKSQVSGVVESIFVEAGNIVKEGQLLAKIRIIPNLVSVNNAVSQLNQAKLNLENARQEFERQSKLNEQKIISDMEYNQFKLDYKLAQEAVDAAENNLQLVKEGASRQPGQVSNEVRATSSGMVLDVPVEEGSFVIETNTFNEGTTIMAIADMNDMIFEGTVDESEVGKIKEGMPLELTVGALQEETFHATLEYISPKGTDDQGAIKFEIRAAMKLPEDHFIRAGYSANADIVLDKKENVLAVKESNLILEEGKAYLEVLVGEQEFERREITTGLSDGIQIEVIKGVGKDLKIKKI